MAEAAKLQIVIEAKDQTKGVFSSVNSEMAQFSSSASQVGGALGGIAKTAAVAGVALGGLAVAGFGAVVKTSMDFSHAMSEVGAAVDDGGASMADLSGKALELGKDTELAGVDATEAAQAIAELARGGVSVGDLMGGAAKGGLLLFSAGASSVEAATGVAVKAMTTFNLAGSEVPHIADLIAAGANKSATSVDELGAAFNQSASVASNAGLSIETLTGTLAFLAQRGIEGSDAGTSLKTALLALQAPTDVAAKTMDDLGIKVRDAQGNMLPFADIAQVLQDKLGGLSAAQRDAALKTIFGNDAIRVGIALMDGGGAAITDWTNKVNDAGYAARIGAAKNNDLFGSFEQLKATIQTGAIEIGQRLEPALRRLTDAGAQLINDFLSNPAVQQGLDQFAANASKAIDDIVARLRDPAFQSQMKEWGQAALATGRAILDLAGTVKDALGPPLAAAVGWFNSLDESGKKNVASFGLVAAAAAGLHKELGTLLSVGGSVVRMFLEKEAAKKSLTAANNTLAGSVGKTATAMGAIKNVVAGATVAFLAGDVAIRAITHNQDGLISFTKSLLQYGDALHKGREAADDFLAGHKDISSLAAYDDQIAKLRQRYAELAATSASFADPSVAALKDLITGSATARNQEMNNITKEIAALTDYRAGVQQTNTAQEQAMRIQAGLAGIQGPFTAGMLQQAVAARELEAATRLAATGNAAFIGPLAVAGPVLAAAAQAQTYYSDATEHTTSALGTYTVAQGQASVAAAAAAPANLAAAQSATFLAETQQVLAAKFAATDTALQTVGQSVSPMTAALDLLNQKVAAGIPLTAEQANLLATLPGAIASTTSGYDGLVTTLAETAVAMQNSNSAAGGAGGAFGGLTDQASVLTGNLNALRSSAIELNGALGALGTENGKLSSEYNLLNDRITALQDKQKTSVGLTSNETGELATLIAARDKLGQKIGDNTAAMRDLVLQQIDNTDKTAAATAAHNGYIAAMGKLSQAHGEARNGLVGLTDGFGNVTSATGTATGAISGGGVAAAAAALKVSGLTISAAKLKLAVGEIPTAHATEVTTPGAAEAKTAVDLITTAISNVPKSFNVTATVDISGALASIQTLSNSMPHSPAKEGPLSVLPNWMALFEELPDAAAKAGAEAASAVSKAITDVLGAMTALAHFDFANDSPTGDDMGWFGFLTSSIIATMQDAAKGFSEEALKAVGEFADTVGKVGGSIKNAVEGLTLLGTTKWADISPDGNAMGWFMHLVSSLVENFRQAAESFDADGLAAAATFAEAVGKVTGVLKTATDGLSALRAFVAPAEATVSRFMASLSDLMEKFGTWASGFEQDGLAQSTAYAEAVGKVTGVLKTATDGLAALLKFTPPAEVNVSRFMASLSDLMEKFGTWAGGFEADGLAQSSVFAEAVGKVTGVIDNGVKGLDALKGFVAPAEAAVSTFLTSLSDLMEKFGTWAGGFEEDGLAAAAVFAESAGKVVAVIGPAVDGFGKLATLAVPSDAAISNLAAGIRSIVQKFADMAKTLDSEGTKATGDFAAAANTALGAAKTGVELFAAMAGDKDKAGNNQPIGVPSKEAIDKLVIAIKYVVLQFAYMAAEMESEGVKQMQAFASAAGQVLAAAKSGTDLFKDMEKLAVPSKEAIDYLLGTIGYVISQTRAIANGIGTEGLQQAQLFATGSLNVFTTLKGALELFKTLTEFKDIPSKALEELNTKLIDTLDWAEKIWKQSEALKAVALSFADNMKEAARAFAEGMSLGAGLPQDSPLTAPTGVGGGGGWDYSKGGGGGGKTVNVTIANPVLLGRESVVAQQIANIVTNAQGNQIGYSV